MATINGLTAAAMRAIRDGAIVGAAVDGFGHLILEKFDGSFLDTGSVIGPQGDVGPAGPVPEAPVDGGYYVRRNGFWVPVPAPPVLEAPSDNGYYVRRNGVWVAQPLPPRQEIGGLQGGVEGQAGVMLTTNSSVYTEMNSANRVPFVVPQGGQIFFVAMVEFECVTGAGHGGGVGLSLISDIPNPVMVTPWGAGSASLSVPTVGDKHYVIFSGIAPFTYQSWTPGASLTATLVASKSYGPTGGVGAGQVSLFGNLAIFGSNN